MLLNFYNDYVDDWSGCCLMYEQVKGEGIEAAKSNAIIQLRNTKRWMKRCMKI